MTATRYIRMTTNVVIKSSYLSKSSVTPPLVACYNNRFVIGSFSVLQFFAFLVLWSFCRSPVLWFSIYSVLWTRSTGPARFYTSKNKNDIFVYWQNVENATISKDFFLIIRPSSGLLPVLGPLEPTPTLDAALLISSRGVLIWVERRIKSLMLLQDERSRFDADENHPSINS